jgi:hypothetical protein
MFYRRIFCGNIFSIVSAGALTVICVWGISFLFATIFECYPTDNIWLAMVGSPERAAHCYTTLPMIYASAILNMIIDVAILSIPMPLVWRLQMPLRQKIAVSAIFLLGSL